MPEAQVVSTKPWWLSKMLWFNFIAVALAAVEANLHVIQPQMSANFYEVFSFGVAVGNAALRFITTSPLALGKQQ
jgi:hypothetical protein